MPSQEAPERAAPPPEAAYERALHAELERRIATLATYGESTFGRLGPIDGVIVVLLCVLLPALLIWMYR